MKIVHSIHFVADVKFCGRSDNGCCTDRPFARHFSVDCPAANDTSNDAIWAAPYVSKQSSSLKLCSLTQSREKYARQNYQRPLAPTLASRPDVILLSNGGLETDSSIDDVAGRNRLLASSVERSSSGSFGISNPIEPSKNSAPKEPRLSLSSPIHLPVGSHVPHLA